MSLYSYTYLPYDAFNPYLRRVYKFKDLKSIKDLFKLLLSKRLFSLGEFTQRNNKDLQFEV